MPLSAISNTNWVWDTANPNDPYRPDYDHR